MPPALDDLILRLLAKQPERRPASADHALAELERIALALPETEAARPARGLARLWARPLVRLGAAAALLAVIGGAAAGGVVMSQAGGGDAAFQELTFHFSFAEDAGEAYVLSGDCQTADLVARHDGAGPMRFSDITGDITGEGFSTVDEMVLFAADGCRSGFQTFTSLIRDSDGNELHSTVAGPVSLQGSPGGEAGSVTAAVTQTVTGGTGIYEGATGGGPCSWQTVFPISEDPQSLAPLTLEGDCTLHLSTEGARWTRAPLIVGLAPIPNRVALFGSQGALPTTVEVLVSYWNGGDEPLTGLSLSLPAPAGATIVTSAEGAAGGAQQGARVWTLPDLPPGGEARRFQFQLQFLAAETGSVPLVVKIDGRGFDEPVRSYPLTIEVVQ